MPAEKNFNGLVGGTGEHRTVGAHRAWCHDCREWCYPQEGCRCCELGTNGFYLEVAAHMNASVQSWDTGTVQINLRPKNPVRR